MVTVWWSAACLIHYSFLNPGKTITSEKYTHQTDELHQKPQYLSQHRSTKRAQFFSTNLTACQTTTASKVGTNLATKFCFIHHIHLTSCQLTTASSSTSTSFFSGEMLPQPAGGRKCFPRVHRTKHRFLYYRKKQTYFSLAKMC